MGNQVGTLGRVRAREVLVSGSHRRKASSMLRDMGRGGRADWSCDHLYNILGALNKKSKSSKGVIEITPPPIKQI